MCVHKIFAVQKLFLLECGRSVYDSSTLLLCLVQSLAGSIHKSMKCEQQEELCCAAQTLLRLLSHGAHREILALVSSIVSGLFYFILFHF